ncbi:MAG: hypothetical protein RI894_2114 [Bacteroidota bacterium]|jgi:thioredoxin-related protein
MKSIFTIITIAALYGATATEVLADQTPKVRFVTGTTFSAIKKRAKAENKLIFIDFYASWCAPCELMDETTFNDERLAAYVDESYIAYKVDVEDFEGYSLKQLFNVKALPTFLVFNANGEKLAQYEESMGAARFMQELKKYDTPKNHGQVEAAEAADDEAPKVIATNNPQRVNEPPKPKVPTPPIRKAVPSQPTLIPVNTKEQNNTAPTYIAKQAPTTNTTTNTTTSTNTTALEPTKKVVPNNEPKLPTTFGEGLYEFNVKKHEAKGYSLQTNTFSQLAFVLKEVSKLQLAFPDEPILVSVATIAGKPEPVYKILVGDFDKESQVEPLRAKLKAINIIPVVKNLATLAPAKQ